MRALTADEVRGSFVNATEPELERLELPWWFDATLWDTLDYLGWVDPATPERGHLVAETSFGVVGVMLRLPKNRPRGRRALCNLCWTQHPGQGALLMVARRAGRAGLNHNTVGTYICADLACSLYARDLKQPARVQPAETLSIEEKVARLQRNLTTFVEWLSAD